MAFTEISPNAAIGEKALNWVDNRFPASKLFKEHLSEYYASKPEFLVHIWCPVFAGAGYSNRDRHFLGHALQARR